MSDIKLAIDAIEPYRRFVSRGRIAGDDLALKAFGEAWHPEEVVTLYSELAATKQKLEAAEKLARDATFDILSIKKDLFQAEQSIREQDNDYVSLYAKFVLAQLHIKELREALQDCNRADSFGQVSCAVEMALSKQPDTRALDKALLEARIDESNMLTTLSEYALSIHVMNMKAKLAELNKELP